MTIPTHPSPNDRATAARGDRARWIARLLADDASSEQRSEAEAALGATDRGRRLLEALTSLSGPETDGVEPLDAPRVDRIMAAVSHVGAGDLPRVADIVLEAWGDPAFREALRRDPAAVLRARGVAIPEHLTLVVVGQRAARLPVADRLELPLPPSGAPAIDANDARRTLAATEFGGLLAAAPGAPTRRASAAPTRAAGRWRQALTGRAFALGALAAVVALGLWTTRMVPGGEGELSGSAVGAPPAVVLVLATLAIAAAFLWWSRRA